MRPSTYQKSFLNRSTKTIVVTATIILWLVVTAAFSAAVFKLESQKIEDQKILRRKSIEETLIRVFEGYAKFGDMINSKGSVLEIGKPFGLSSFNVCKNGMSVPPLPFDDVCSELKHGYSLGLNQENYELFFNWDQESDTELARVFELLLLTSLISLILVTLVVIVFLRVFKIRLFYIASQISSVDTVEGIEHFKLDVPELKPITSSIRNLFEIVNRYSNEISRLKVEEFKTEIARQVAHDIRSPLSALQIAVGRLSNEGEEYSLIVNASQRIREIADDVLKMPLNKLNVSTNEISIVSGKVDDLDSVDLEKVVSSIINEKKLSFSGQFLLDTQEAVVFMVLISKIEIERIISNLLNNSVEALAEEVDPQITVFLRGYDSTVSLSIVDNGPGINEEVLNQLGQKGATFGKVGGSGLGLYSAKSYIEKLGGKLEIQSREGNGTMVTISLPRR